jgi:S-adenosylmethionine decarboxylase
MDKLTPPIVVKGLPEDPGWTGVVIICTSHIAIHTFDKTNLINLDIFSCRDFDHDKVLKYLKEKFNPSEMKHDTWNR